MQIRHVQGAACCFALLAASGIACAASLTSADQQFMTEAARTDMIEAHEGQMAQNQASRADVKTFGGTLVRDHTNSYAQLTVLAAKDGVTIPKGINSAKDRTIEQLVHLKGDRFDRQFVRDEVAAHRHAIAVFKREAEHGQNPDVKAYAQKMIPVLENHLRLAEACAKPVKRG